VSPFDFSAPGRIVFGWGRIAEIGAVAKAFGNRAVIVWGSRTILGSKAGMEIIRALEGEGITVASMHLKGGEPDVATIDELAGLLRGSNPTRDDLIIAIGGGSGLDTGKALAGIALDPDRASIKEFLEGVGSGRRIAWPVLPVVAVPTTAGTGSEATFNAVISSRDPPFKKSFRDQRLMPKVALVDPQLACSAPKQITAWSGMDALTQLIESLLSRKATWTTSLLAMGGLLAVPDSLRRVNADPNDRYAREMLAVAALRSGLALANGGLGLAHGVAAGLGALKGTPHGLACAVMLPAAVALNAYAHREDPAVTWTNMQWMMRQPREEPVINDQKKAHAWVLAEIRSLIDELGIPSRLGELGVTNDDIPELVRLSQGSSMSGNPKSLTEDELRALLEYLL